MSVVVRTMTCEDCGGDLRRPGVLCAGCTVAREPIERAMRRRRRRELLADVLVTAAFLIAVALVVWDTFWGLPWMP